MLKTITAMALLAASFMVGVSAVSAMNFGAAPAEIATVVPTRVPTSVATPWARHHHHFLIQTSTVTAIGTVSPTLTVVPMATPQPIAIPTIQ